MLAITFAPMCLSSQTSSAHVPLRAQQTLRCPKQSYHHNFDHWQWFYNMSLTRHSATVSQDMDTACTRTIFNLQRFVRRKRKDRPELGPPWTANHPGVAVILTIDSHIEVAKKPHSYHNKQRQVGASVLWSPWEHASCWPCSWPASRMLIWAGIWPPKTP